MSVNSTLAGYSDLAFRTALVVYCVALVASAVYYWLKGAAIDLARGLAQGRQTADPSRLAQLNLRAQRTAGGVLALVWLGVLFHLSSIVLRGLATARFPWGNLYEYISISMLLAVVAAALFLRRRDLAILWTWVLAPVIALLFYGGTKLYAESAPVVPALRSFWLPVHVSVVSLGAGLALVSGIASVLYLLRTWQEPGQEQGPLAKLITPLPAAELLDRVAYRTAVLTVPVFGAGVVLGALWAEAAWGRYWGWDPKETMAFVTWVLYAAYLHARATKGFGRQVAPVINLLGFAAMITNLLPVNMFVNSLHSYAGLN